MYPLALGGVCGQGQIKTTAEDFCVIEELGFAPGGGGEHLWLFIEKRDWNTEDVALYLAKQANIHRLSVGYSGLKDKHALTQQWFSLHLPGKADPEFDWPQDLRCLSAVRHHRKLNRGTHRFNRFQLVVRNLQVDEALLVQRLQEIAQRGVPNYFGAQRMGHFNNNLARAMAWLGAAGEAPRKRSLRSLWLSAMRSHLFNLVLAERVRRGVWDQCLMGDILQPEGSRGLFYAATEPQAHQRVANMSVHPTAPLPGVAPMMPGDATQQLETQVLAPFGRHIEGLCQQQVKAARRATRLPVYELEWQQGDAILQLGFRLPAGAFATVVLGELIGDKEGT